MTRILPSTYNSLKTAYHQDWPFGRKRCIRSIWVETNNKGQRFCYATTTRETSSDERRTPDEIEEVVANGVRYNKTKCATYNALTIIVIDDKGRTQVDGLSKYAWQSQIEEFEAKYWELLDHEQRKRFLEVKNV